MPTTKLHTICSCCDSSYTLHKQQEIIQLRRGTIVAGAKIAMNVSLVAMIVSVVTIIISVVAMIVSVVAMIMIVALTGP